MWPAIAAGVQALGSYFGGKKIGDAQRQANEINAANAERNIALQREFAQSGIQWKVEDAKKAGIHPLYALGAGTTSFAPVSVGATAVTGPGQAAAAMGQDIGRAINATRSGTDRLQAVSEAASQLQLENMHLQNQLLASQIRKINSPANPSLPVGDNMLIDGQGGTLVAPKDKPLDRVVSMTGQPESEHAAIADIGYARTKYGHYPVPSKDVKERIEDNIVQEVAHWIRNNVPQMFGARMSPPYPAPSGKVWRYNILEGYYLAPKGSLLSLPGN